MRPPARWWLVAADELVADAMRRPGAIADKMRRPAPHCVVVLVHRRRARRLLQHRVPADVRS